MIVIGLLMGVVAIAAVLGGSRKETPRKVLKELEWITDESKEDVK